MGRSCAASLSTNVVVCSHHVHRSPQILVVQVREPVWQVLRGPGIWVPFNLISTACLHWSCACYPLCRETPSSQLCHCAGQSAAGLPDAPLTSLGAESRQEQLKKSTSEYSAFQHFFLPTALCMKLDMPWGPSPSPVSTSARASPGTAAMLSPFEGQQEVGLIQSQICSTALLSQSPGHKQHWALFGPNSEKVLAVLPRGCYQGHYTPLPFTLLTDVLQEIFSAIILMLSQVDINIFASGARASVCCVWILAAFKLKNIHIWRWVFFLRTSTFGGGCFFSHRLSHSPQPVSGFLPALQLLAPLPSSGTGDDTFRKSAGEMSKATWDENFLWGEFM